MKIIYTIKMLLVLTAFAPQPRSSFARQLLRDVSTLRLAVQAQLNSSLSDPLMMQQVVDYQTNLLELDTSGILARLTKLRTSLSKFNAMYKELQQAAPASFVVTASANNFCNAPTLDLSGATSPCKNANSVPPNAPPPHCIYKHYKVGTLHQYAKILPVKSLGINFFVKYISYFAHNCWQVICWHWLSKTTLRDKDLLPVFFTNRLFRTPPNGGFQEKSC